MIMQRRGVFKGLPHVSKRMMMTQFGNILSFSHCDRVDNRFGIAYCYHGCRWRQVPSSASSDLRAPTRCLWKCRCGSHIASSELVVPRWLPSLCSSCGNANSNHPMLEDSFVSWNYRCYGVVPADGTRSDGGDVSGMMVCNGRRQSSSVVAAEPSQIARVEAQKALLDYLHGTRALQFPDAEHISKNSPMFLHKLIVKVGGDAEEREVGWSISKFLSYHPINEFEPFFESLGVKETDIPSILPCDCMFLGDDETLLQNYHLLCDYGVPRSRLGKMYVEAREVFRYEPAMLMAHLEAYERLGLSIPAVVNVVSCCPSLLVGGINRDFVDVFKILKSLGVGEYCIFHCLLENSTYHWDKMLQTLEFFKDLGFGEKELGALLRKHPGFLLEESGNMVFLIVGLLAKLGACKKDLSKLFLHFPDVRVQCFVKNLHKGLLFLIEIDMPQEDICRIMCSHPQLFGCCSLKTAQSTLSLLNVGKKRLCRIILADPYQLMNWTLKKKISRLPKLDKDLRWLMHKTDFLLRLGFAKNSDEMRKALTVFRGKGTELQERYDYFTERGLDPQDVTCMVKMAPHILNQKVDVLKSKIDLLVNDLGYPVQFLLAFPSYLSYTVKRARTRFIMYNWLRDKGVVKSLTLSTILPCSEESFLRRFVMQHPDGPQVWKILKNDSIPSS